MENFTKVIGEATCDDCYENIDTYYESYLSLEERMVKVCKDCTDQYV